MLSLLQVISLDEAQPVTVEQDEGFCSAVPKMASHAGKYDR